MEAGSLSKNWVVDHDAIYLGAVLQLVAEAHKGGIGI